MAITYNEQPELALQVLWVRRQLGSTPEMITYNFLISACGRVAQTEKALGFVKVMQQPG